MTKSWLALFKLLFEVSQARPEFIRLAFEIHESNRHFFPWIRIGFTEKNGAELIRINSNYYESDDDDKKTKFWMKVNRNIF